MDNIPRIIQLYIILSDFGLDWEKVILALVENYEQFTEQCNKTFETIFAFDSKH